MEHIEKRRRTMSDEHEDVAEDVKVVLIFARCPKNARVVMKGMFFNDPAKHVKSGRCYGVPR